SGDRVGEELIEVGVVAAAGAGALVLGVTDEDAGTAFPPGEVGLEMERAGLVEGQAAGGAAAVGGGRTEALGEGRVGETEGVAEGGDDEVLEDLVHVDEEGETGNRTVAE